MRELTRATVDEVNTAHPPEKRTVVSALTGEGNLVAHLSSSASGALPACPKHHPLRHTRVVLLARFPIEGILRERLAVATALQAKPEATFEKLGRTPFPTGFPAFVPIEFTTIFLPLDH